MTGDEKRPLDGRSMRNFEAPLGFLERVAGPSMAPIDDSFSAADGGDEIVLTTKCPGRWNLYDVYI